MSNTYEVPESATPSLDSSEEARSRAISLLSQWAQSGTAVAYTTCGLRYSGFLYDCSLDGAIIFEFRARSVISSLILPLSWTELAFDTHQDWVAVNVKDQSGREYSVGPDRYSGALIHSAANKVEIVKDQLRRWCEVRTTVGITVCHPPYDLTFFGNVVEVIADGCFIEKEGGNSLLSLSFQDSMCSAGTHDIEGVTRLQVELRHLHTGTTVQIFEGVHGRKIRRCTSTSIQ